MSRYDCVRCGTECFTTDDEHICKDVRDRLVRRERQANAVFGLLNEQLPNPNPDNDYRRKVAENIVEVLAKLGVEQD